jgi:iron complex outermembrane recepter protein
MRGFSRDTTIKGDVMLTICRRSFGVLAICLITWFSTPAAFAQTLYDFNLPQQALADSLRAIGHQTSVNILFDPHSVEKLTAPAVHGQFSANQAVNRVLAGTNLAAEQTETNTLLVEPKDRSGKAQAAAAALNDPPDSRVALAQAQTPSSQNQNVENSSGPESSSKSEERAGLTEIVVTGTHIRGVAPLSPVKTITNQDLVDQGYTRLDQAIAQLPENFGDGSSVQSNSTLFVGPSAANNPSFGSSVNLFGLGVGTTLILLNGQRLAPTGAGSHVDISGIPASVIDRVEIVEDGASAVYGSDAVGGVVNIITRKDYDGVETGGRVTSISDGKTPNYGGYVLAGTSWGTGNVVANFDYEKDNPLLADSRSFTSSIPGPLYLLPEGENYRFYVSGTQTITSQLAISGQLLVPYRTYSSYSNEGPYLGVVSYVGSELQPSGAIGLTYDFTPGWQAALSGDFSEDRNQYPDEGYSVGPVVSTGKERNSATTGEARLGGPLFNLPGGAAQLALGGQFRTENYWAGFTSIAAGVPQPIQPVASGHRDAESTYGEVLLPLIGEENNIPLIRELAIDGAGRFDHYSDFGSSTNPKVTVKWVPLEGLSIHGTYTTSFRAPTFDDLLEQRYLYLYPENNPASPSGVSRTILLDGGNPDLEAERSKSFSAGLDYKSPLVTGLSGSLSYFHFDYTQRIEHLFAVAPWGFNGFLANAAQLGPLITLNPTAAEIASAYASVPLANQLNYGAPPGTPASIAAIAQVGFINAAASVVSGLNGNLRYDAKTDFGEFIGNVDATYLTKSEEQIAPGSQPYTLLNTLAGPLKFRAKGMLNWRWNQLAAYGRVNFANAYQNASDLSCGASGCPIASWTTFDMGLSYSTPPSADHRLSSGLRIGLDVVNIFDRAPPYALTPSAAGNLTYDPINANPLLRAFSLTVTKKW